jgi:hypothetical protein
MKRRKPTQEDYWRGASMTYRSRWLRLRKEMREIVRAEAGHYTDDGSRRVFPGECLCPGCLAYRSLKGER